MDQQMLNHLHHLYAAGSFRNQYLLAVVNLVVLQNLGELNLVADLTYPVAVHLLRQLVEPADVERHQLKMDYFQDVVDVEPRHQLRMDYFLGVVLASLA